MKTQSQLKMTDTVTAKTASKIQLIYLIETTHIYGFNHSTQQLFIVKTSLQSLIPACQCRSHTRASVPNGSIYDKVSFIELQKRQ